MPTPAPALAPIAPALVLPLPSPTTVRIARAVLNAARLDMKAGLDVELNAKADKACHRAITLAMGKHASALFGAKAPTIPELDPSLTDAQRMAIRAARFAWNAVALAQSVAKEAIAAVKVA